MSVERQENISGSPLNKPFLMNGPLLPGFIMADIFKLKSVYPLGSVLDAFVTNVYNVPQLRFFMFVKNVENAEHFANVRYACTPPNAYKCLRTPREGYVFAWRVGDSTMVRAIRLRTMCITKNREVFLPDIGRNEMLDENDIDMYHLPLNLRLHPGLAIPCQLRGVNDDVTILPDNMRSFLKGLLFRSVKLRVDGYVGGMLKVQLLHVNLNQLMKWTNELGAKEVDFSYALKNTIISEPKNMEVESPNAAKDKELFLSMVSKRGSMHGLGGEKMVEQDVADQDSNFSLDLVNISGKMNFSSSNQTAMYNFGPRPVLGGIKKKTERPILGGNNVVLTENSWKRDFLPALMLIDKRQTKISFSNDEIIKITPTYVGQLERFFGIVHRRNESYIQYMWTDDEIPRSTRFSSSRFPYVFDVVLAKHSGDFKWYRAKVIEISKEKRKVMVFFVDYGGIEYVDVANLAYASASIASLPFQVFLFRLYNLFDVTTSKAEHSLGIELLRSVLLKTTLTARVVFHKNHEITISFEDQRFSHVPATHTQGLYEKLLCWNLK